MSKVSQMVSNQILDALDNGVVPWRKPWNTIGANAMPRNAWNKQYRGINVFLLNWARQSKGYTSNFWVTYKQAAKQGGQVRKGEKGQTVVFWKVGKATREFDEDKGKMVTRRPFMLRYFTVFNLKQIDNMKLTKAMQAEQDAIEAGILVDQTGDEQYQYAEAIIGTYLSRDEAPGYEEMISDSAYYMPSEDRIVVPSREQYEHPEEFYSTTFHEFAHSTGHDSRLKRGKGNAFGSHDYGKEELVAEFTSAMLMGESGLSTTVENSTAYIQNWKDQIKADPNLVVAAAGQAQKAADYILGVEYKKDDDEGTEKDTNTAS